MRTARMFSNPGLRLSGGRSEPIAAGGDAHPTAI
jgi:hypothetical protein